MSLNKSKNNTPVVLIENCDYYVGGVQRVNVDLANYLADVKEFTVYLSSPAYGDENNYEISSNVKKIYPPHDTKMFRRMIFLTKFLFKHKVTCYFALYNKLRFIAILFRIPKIYYILHNTYKYNNKETAFEIVLKHFSKYVAVSNAVKIHHTKVLNIKPEKIELIYNGVDLNKFKPSHIKTSDDHVRVIHIGRLHNWKGQDYLINSLSYLKDIFSKFTLTIVGDGPEADALHKLAEKIDPSGKTIKFLGERLDTPELLQASDIFVATPRQDGFAIVFAEAMACGLPVIGFDVGPIKEVIGINKENAGILVPFEDTKCLSEKLRELILNQEERQKRAKNCLKRSRKFDIVKSWESYAQLVEK